MKIRLFSICLFVLFAIFAFNAEATFAQTGRLVISNLKGDYSGCGCAFQTLADSRKRNSMKFVFWSEDEKTAIVNINGRDTTFRAVKKGRRPTVFRVGNRFSDEFRSGNITLRIDYTVTRVCGRLEEDCESTSFDSTITVVRGKSRTVLKTKGDCGC